MPTAIHAFSPEEIMAYLDGELSPDRSLAAAKHLKDCTECQLLVADLASLSRNLTAWEVETSVLQAPQMEAAHPRTWRRPWLIGCAAALVLVGIFATMRPQRSIMSPPAPPRLAQYALFFSAPAESSAPRRASGPLIVRTAQLSLFSENFDHVRSEVERITKEHRGYIGQLDLNSTAGSSRTLAASLRAPADELNTVISELRQLGHVNSESESGEDVTQRSVDLDARLANLRNTEARLQQLLRDRTGKLEEVLAVEQAVDRTRGEIETAEAERKTLSNQISFATLQLTVSEPKQSSTSISTRLRTAAIDGYRSAVAAVLATVVFLLSVGPTLLIVLAIAFFPARRYLRNHRHSKIGSA